MSSVADSHGHPHADAHGSAGHAHGHGDHHGGYSGIMRWITTTNHKDIGTLYLWFSFIMFMVGGVMAMAIRLELFQPGIQYFNPDLFNQFTTMHGLIMVFGAIMPAFVGFANWQIPMMIGAPDMAFARLNNWSFWLLPFAGMLLILSFFVPGGAMGGGYDYYDFLQIRGFSNGYAANYHNGLPLEAITGLETALLDRIEVVKGPASILYGRIEPGGLVNLVYKRPQRAFAAHVEQQVGEFGLLRTVGDVTGSLSRDGQWTYRLVGAHTQSDSFVDFVEKRNTVGAAFLSWNPHERFGFNLRIEGQRNRFVDTEDEAVAALGLAHSAATAIGRLMTSSTASASTK